MRLFCREESDSYELLQLMQKGALSNRTSNRVTLNKYQNYWENYWLIKKKLRAAARLWNTAWTCCGPYSITKWRTRWAAWLCTARTGWCSWFRLKWFGTTAAYAVRTTTRSRTSKTSNSTWSRCREIRTRKWTLDRASFSKPCWRARTWRTTARATTYTWLGALRMCAWGATTCICHCRIGYVCY